MLKVMSDLVSSSRTAHMDFGDQVFELVSQKVLAKIGIPENQWHMIFTPTIISNIYQNQELIAIPD